MRKIQLTGLPAAVSSEVTNGVVRWVDESLAYWLVKNGEAVYTRAVDAVSDARYSELCSMKAENYMRQLADLGLKDRWTAAQVQQVQGYVYKTEDFTAQIAQKPVRRF